MATEPTGRQDHSEAAFLAQYSLSHYPPMAVTVDLACLTIRGGRLAVLLIERGGHPFRGRWALPGGFARADETLSESAHRELAEETATSVAHSEQLGTYGDPGRDPRGHIISVAYLAFGPDMANPEAGDDAAAARFWTIEDLDLDGNRGSDTGHGAGIDLAFDHRLIIADAVERARAKLEYTTLGCAFCAETFTMVELRDVYEAAWGTPVHPANFRRKVLSTPGFVIPVGTAASNGRGRPAELYRQGPATRMNPPLLRPG
ncbi:MAG TPA: NUDIX domain-containing protein [Acidimicrobiales bacterium]|nr:NUDIX domain-containing protein [Acidimicrobiales bacterium]